VDVVSHAGSIAAAVKTLVCGYSLAFGHSGSHGHSIRLAVEDHSGVTSKLSRAIDEESSVAASAVSVWISLAHHYSGVWGVHGRSSITLDVPSTVHAAASGCAIISAPIRVASSFLVGTERGAKSGGAVA